MQGHPRTDPAVTSLHEIASWPKTLTAGYYLTILSFTLFYIVTGWEYIFLVMSMLSLKEVTFKSYLPEMVFFVYKFYAF